MLTDVNGTPDVNFDFGTAFVGCDLEVGNGTEHFGENTESPALKRQTCIDFAVLLQTADNAAFRHLKLKY